MRKIKRVNEINGIDLSTIFPYKKEEEFANIYSLEPIESYQLKDFDAKNAWGEDIRSEISNLDRFTLPAGTRIGVLDYDYENDPDEYLAENRAISLVIEVTSEMNYYNDTEEMINDSMIYFEVSKDKAFTPSSEPVDVISTGWTNGGGREIEKLEKIKELVKLYDLQYLLIGV